MAGNRERADVAIAERWRVLLRHIWEEAADQGRDADAFVHPDLAERTIRARLFADPTGETSFAVTISRAQLLEGDLRDLARRFIAAYITAFDASWPPQ